MIEILDQSVSEYKSHEQELLEQSERDMNQLKEMYQTKLEQLQTGIQACI